MGSSSRDAAGDGGEEERAFVAAGVGRGCRLGGAPVTRMLKEGIQRLRFLRRTVARNVRRAEMCGGSSEIDFEAGEGELADEAGDGEDREHRGEDQEQEIIGGEDGGERDDDDGSAIGESGAGDLLAEGAGPEGAEVLPPVHVLTAVGSLEHDGDGGVSRSQSAK